LQIRHRLLPLNLCKSTRIPPWQYVLAWSSLLVSSPAWSAPNSIESPNSGREKAQLQSIEPLTASTDQSNSLSCRSSWQSDAAQVSVASGSSFQQAKCDWSYQALLHKKNLSLVETPAKKAPVALDKPSGNYLHDGSKKPSRRLSTSRTKPVASKAIAPVFPKEQELSKTSVSLAEPTRNKNRLTQAQSFKADYVRVSRSYRAATLGPLQSLQSTIDFDSASSGLEPTDTSNASVWFIGQAEPERSDTDPDLGILRLEKEPTSLPQQPNSPNNPQAPQAACPNPDPDLGCIPIEPWVPPPPPRAPIAYLLPRIDYFRSSNVFSAIDPVDDGFFRPGLTLFVAPPLGPKTYVVASVTGNFIRYSTQTQIDYNELLADVGIFQQLSPTMFGKIGWNYQQLFIYRDKIFGLPAGTRFLSDHAVKLELSRRDQLIGKLSISTFYQLRIGFAEPADRSRLINSLIASLNYDIQPTLQVGLDYQFALAHFTQQAREDAYHQIGLRLTYTMFRNTQVNLFAGYSFGRSSDRTVDFNGLVFGVSLGTNLPLF